MSGRSAERGGQSLVEVRRVPEFTAALDLGVGTGTKRRPNSVRAQQVRVSNLPREVEELSAAIVLRHLGVVRAHRQRQAAAERVRVDVQTDRVAAEAVEIANGTFLTERADRREEVRLRELTRHINVDVTPRAIRHSG